MAYLAVDKTKKEYLFEKKPIRNKDEYWETLLSRGISYDHIDYDCYQYEPNLKELGIELPQGSIEKLIGYSFTWDDEPLELK